MPFIFGRIALDSPEHWTEQMGDPVTNLGGAPVPAVRSALRHSVDVPTFSSPIGEDTVERRMRLRRQLRSLLNNTGYKMLGVYLLWDDDPEQNGWYIPDQGQLAEGADSPLTHGYFKLENFVWFKVGAPRTHRPAIGLSLKDLRTGLWARDVLRSVYSTDFAALPAVPLVYLHAGATDLINAVNHSASPFIQALPAGRDGGQTLLLSEQVAELQDLAVFSYNQPDASRNLGDVVAYDRRGLGGLPVKGEDPQKFGWEEIYGPDYEYTAGSVPVLDNGRVRVVYDATNLDGFRVYTWNGTEYVEQGKVTFSNAGNNAETIGVASLKEYTPERAVLEVPMLNLNVSNGRMQVFVTLQRGWSGPRFEVYQSPGLVTEPQIMWTAPAQHENTSVVKVDAAGGAINATAGTGSTVYAAEATLGATTFTGENEIGLVQQGLTTQVNLAVVQVACKVVTLPSSAAYGTTQNALAIRAASGNAYNSVQVSFGELKAAQLLEAENMTLGAGSAVTADAAASNGKAVTATRTTDANAGVTKANWPGEAGTSYRLYARVKTSASTLKIYGKMSGSAALATKTTKSAGYVWLDLGLLAVNSTAETLEIHCWAEAAATTSIDRIEAVLMEDRETPFGDYEGARDLGQAVLIDSRAMPTVVTRT